MHRTPLLGATQALPLLMPGNQPYAPSIRHKAPPRPAARSNSNALRVRWMAVGPRLTRRRVTGPSTVVHLVFAVVTCQG